MRGLNIDIFAGSGFPVGCESGINRFIKLAGRVIRYIEQSESIPKRGLWHTNRSKGRRACKAAAKSASGQGVFRLINRHKALR